MSSLWEKTEIKIYPPYLFNLKNGELTYSSDSLSINFKCDKF